ncbi:hypothetical protein EVAR_59136_1 [Eumeta japonica]|uniref:Uncharacterized protein n=1 Tax=Eumeta variegata TaxID=151549 RepID=A0A4C1Z947_EUMVA|nr:hypothetical protein EVAR_59136_1 [Eumeta japonica]
MKRSKLEPSQVETGSEIEIEIDISARIGIENEIAIRGHDQLSCFVVSLHRMALQHVNSYTVQPITMKIIMLLYLDRASAFATRTGRRSATKMKEIDFENRTGIRIDNEIALGISISRWGDIKDDEYSFHFNAAGVTGKS